MKRSYMIASLIILFGAIISWPDWQKFTRTKEKNAQLFQAAPTLSSAHHQETSQTNRANDRDTESTTDGKTLALDYIKMLRLSKGYKNRQNPSEEFSRERMLEIEASLKNLRLSQIKSFLVEFHQSIDPSEFSSRDISDKTKSLIKTFAEKYPTEMIDLVNKSPEIFNNDPKKINDALFAVIFDIAHHKNDPTTTFQCLPKLEPRLQEATISILVGAVNNPEKRTETLDAMRAYAITPEQKKW